MYGYVLRIKDGGPILVPTWPDYALRHIDALDVVKGVMKLIESGPGKGKAYNFSQEETVSLAEFLDILGDVVGMSPNVQRVEREMLMANGFLPDCSPFSELWMSELDNTRSKTELGMTYTPLADTVARIVAHYEQHPPVQPASYRRRQAERSLVAQG